MSNHHDLTEEKIIMTPKSKTERSTTIIIERREVSVSDISNNKVHVAGGAHAGIIIEKELTNSKWYLLWATATTNAVPL